VADYFAVRLRDERDREPSGLAQCADDMLLGVTGMRRMQKRGDGHSFNSCDISRGLFPYAESPHAHFTGTAPGPPVRPLEACIPATECRTCGFRGALSHLAMLGLTRPTPEFP